MTGKECNAKDGLLHYPNIDQGRGQRLTAGSSMKRRESSKCICSTFVPSASSLHFRHVLYRYCLRFGEPTSVGPEVATCQRCEIWTLQWCGIRYFRYFISFVWDRCLVSVGCTDPAHVEMLAFSVSLLPELQPSRYFIYWMNACGECWDLWLCSVSSGSVQVCQFRPLHISTLRLWWLRLLWRLVGRT